MTTDYSVLNDQLVTMAFITQLTGLTDKWFYKLIQDGEFPKPIKLGRSGSLAAATHCSVPAVTCRTQSHLPPDLTLTTV